MFHVNHIKYVYPKRIGVRMGGEVLMAVGIRVFPAIDAFPAISGTCFALNTPLTSSSQNNLYDFQRRPFQAFTTDWIPTWWPPPCELQKPAP